MASRPLSNQGPPACPPRAAAAIDPDRPSASSPRRIAVRALGPGAAGFTLLPVEAIAYAFFGASLARRQPNAMAAEPRVYLRAVMSAAASGRAPAKSPSTFVTHHRSLAGLRRGLDPAQFVPISRSVLVNLAYLVEIDPAVGKRNVVVVDVGGGFRESLLVSRRRFARLRQALGIPRRTLSRRARQVGRAR